MRVDDAGALDFVGALASRILARLFISSTGAFLFDPLAAWQFAAAANGPHHAGKKIQNSGVPQA